MIETTTYKCEYCGAEFDDEHEAYCHEWVCRYKDVTKRKDSCLGFYREDGTEIKFGDVAFVWADFDNDVYAFTVGNESDIKFVKELFDYCGFGNPFPTIINEANLNYYSLYYGIWWFDADMYHGAWVRVDDQIKRWTDIKNKFIKDGQYMFGKIMEYMFGGFLIVFTGILMIVIIALIVWLIIDFIKNGA